MLDKETINALETVARPTTERALLSICLKNNDMLLELKDRGVIADMFLIEANKIIYNAMTYLYSRQQGLASYTIMEVIGKERDRKTVIDYGGMEYINLLAEQITSENTIDILVDKLKQAYIRYNMFSMCNDTKKKMLSDDVEVMNTTEIIAEHEAKINEFARPLISTRSVYKMGDELEEVMLRRAERPKGLPGLSVGFPMYDYYTNGGQPGDLIMICARAKTGKSTMLTNWAVKLGIKDRLPVIYFDTEMSYREQEDRMLSILTKIPHKEIVSGEFAIDTANGRGVDKMEKVKAAIEEIKAGKYYHVYMPNFTIEKVNLLSKKFKEQHNIKAIFFDYLKFPSSQVATLRSVQEWQMLGYIASGLKDLAGMLEVPVFSACQENRANLDGKKDERNVGGSDRILQLASKLMFLSNKSEEDMIRQGAHYGNQRLYIAFQRSGESDISPINIQFDKEILTQREI